MSETTKLVFARERSDSAKLGPVSATYAAQQSCPTTCPFLGAGCYAENGFTSMVTTKRLNRAAQDRSPLAIAREEATAIDGLTGERDLRLHVVGDSTTIEGTRLIAAAAARYIARHGKRVWTYTHAWRTVPRDAWGEVSVLASCETEADVIDAQARGYATAVAIEVQLTDRMHRDGALNVLPCPEQTRGVRCAECRLCLDDGRLRADGITIAFALHGSRYSLDRATKALAGAQG